ncbi:putative UDP-glucuronate 4-epimerase [Helianthus annuus]|uniref:UDP-glucuronate 4-epimerase n=1 Tax=Helianthus annuus TaxID=4232 RepID=A0A9K3EMF7_HELAN|nr:putative UDP-glucuronate 4-epimerase [Helianthus annuus]
MHIAIENGPRWEKTVDSLVNIRLKTGYSVLGIRAAGFVGIHVSAALKRCVDYVLWLDNCNNYYDPTHKRASTCVGKNGIFIVEGDINDTVLLTKLFEVVHFTHVMHLAAQAGVRYAMQNPKSYIHSNIAGVRYAMQNPKSYIHSNIAGFVNVLEVCKNANPQPAIIWASSSSVYGLNTEVPFAEKDRTDQPASLYAATKKAGEEIAHTYNHIYGLSLTGLRFFTVYGPWGRLDMAYFFFTKDILKRKPIPIFESSNHGTFTLLKRVQEVVGRKKGAAQFRIFNLGNTLPVPVSDLVSILEKLLKVKAERRVMKLPRNGDVPFTHANISLAQREFGYKPTTDLQTGLKKFVRWYEKYYGSGKKSDH